MSITKKNWKAVLFFLSPAVIIYGVFVWIPVFRTFFLSFFKWSGYSKNMQYLGISNFIEIFSDEIFLKALVNNLSALAMVILITLPVALLLSDILGRQGSRMSFFRATWLFPNFLGAAFVGILWLFIYDPVIGLLNGLLEAAGLGTKVWLGDSDTALPALTFALIWSRLGFYILLFLGSILNIPDELYDASKVDGVNKWQEFWFITLPLIKQSIAVAAVFMVTWSFNYLFAVINITTEGGPAHATEIVPSFIVKMAFGYSRFGYASAAGMVMIFLLLILTTFILKTLMGQAGRGKEA
jgi:ABC-type sugar transport system permease subunit